VARKSKVTTLKLDDLIFNQDNFRHISDKSIDFILTDPPFNIAKETNFHTYKNNTIHSYKFDSKAEEKWDSFTHEGFLKEMDNWVKEFNRVLKVGGNFAIFCADSYLSHFMDILKANGLSPRRVISWSKPNAVPINRAYMPTSAVEYIIVGVKKGKAVFNADVNIIEQKLDSKLIEAVLVSDKAASIISSMIRQELLETAIEGSDLEHIEKVKEIVIKVLDSSKKKVLDRVSNMYKINKEGEKYLQACVPNYVAFPLKTGSRIHPTEKPVILLQYLLALYSKPGDKVLDSFAGSGSTGEACLLFDRVPVLIEREKKYYQKAKERITKFL